MCCRISVEVSDNDRGRLYSHNRFKRFSQQLKQLAQNEGVDISKLIERQFNISTSINTGQENVSRNLLNPSEKEAQNEYNSQNGFSVNAFPKRVKVGWGRNK